MRNIIIILSFTLISAHLYGQIEIFFPNYADQAQKNQLSYSYIDGFPIILRNENGSEINITSCIQNISTDNGAIFRDTLYNASDYICKPKRLGKCTVKIIAELENGKKKTFAKSINIIQTPSLEFKIITSTFHDSTKIIFQLIDNRTNEDVSKEYFTTYFILHIGENNSNKDYYINSLLGVIDFKKEFGDRIKIKKGDKVTCEFLLWGKKSDLFASFVKKEIIIQ